MGMWDWLPGRRRLASRSERQEIKQTDLDIRRETAETELLELRNKAVARVVAEATDPIEGLSVVAVAAYKGKGQPPALPRRPKDDDPLREMALEMIRERGRANPVKEMMETLDGVIRFREHLEEGADRVSGRRRRRDQDGGGFVDVLATFADTELGKAVGAGMGQVIATGRLPAPPQLATPPSVVESPVPSPERPAEAPTAPDPVVVSAEPAGPIPLEVQIAVQHMRQMQPADAAEWILDHAKRNPVLAQLVTQFVDAEPEQIPAFLRQAAVNPAIGQWLPVVRHLADNPWWTMALHARMDELLADEEPAGPEAAAQ